MAEAVYPVGFEDAASICRSVPIDRSAGKLRSIAAAAAAGGPQTGHRQDTCDSCDANERDLKCSVCRYGVCKDCFASASFFSLQVWRCPGCDTETSIEQAVSAVEHDIVHTKNKPYGVIHRALRVLNTTASELCVQGVLRGVIHTRTLGVRLAGRKGGRVTLTTSSQLLVRALLHAPGTLFTVGKVALSGHECRQVCGQVCGQVCTKGAGASAVGVAGDGRVFIVDENCLSIELVGMFGACSALVRSWLVDASTQ